MTTKELLRQKPETQIIDIHSGSKFTVAEITSLIVEILTTSETEADQFCKRFELVTKN